MKPQISRTAQNAILNSRIDQLETEKAELRDLLEKEIAINVLKTGFLAQASHELKSPLTSIQLSTALIDQYYQRLDQAKILSHLAKIKDAVGNFVVILNHYLLSEECAVTDEDQFIK